MHTVGFVAFADFQALGLAVSSVFEYTNILRGEKVYQFKLVSEAGGPVMTSQSFSVNTERLRDSTYDTLIVAGDNECNLPPQSLLDYLHNAPNECRRVTAICTGAFILAAAGLLDGKRATTHWMHAQRFRKEYPNVMLDEDRIFVTDGQIWTSAGMTAGIDLALAIVEKDFGLDTARQVARKLVVYQRRGGGQSQFSALLELDAKSDRIQMALSYAKENLNSDLSVESLAEAASISPRHFSRVFRATRPGCFWSGHAESTGRGAGPAGRGSRADFVDSGATPAGGEYRRATRQPRRGHFRQGGDACAH